MFNKGQEVICVDGNFHPESIKLIPNLPVQDKLYTIRDFFKSKGESVVLLEEIINPHLPLTQDNTSDGGHGFTFEPTFAARRFAPLIEHPPIEEFVEEFDLVSI